jgi:prepilin-type processing-associated H-X9-DG protein
MTDMHHLSGLNKSFAGFSGRHDGKVNMCICDGSVRLVNEDIDSSLEGGVLQNLGTRNGGEVMGDF